jgi:hypothetical protein
MISAAAAEIEFKSVCDVCGTLGIKITDLQSDRESTVVECARCDAPRGHWALFGSWREAASASCMSSSDWLH